ncbi:hypothetical protein Pssp01_44750 [Pseudomonas sp. NBRC 100443]|nr:hypothetical protein Pssp01_44750 [Pseudomonas sp. NBRC 100443]
MRCPFRGRGPALPACRPTAYGRRTMGTILLVILILLLIGGLPVYPYSRSWGYGPSGILGVVLVVLLVMLLLGYV